jgi:hypothetical protein
MVAAVNIPKGEVCMYSTSSPVLEHDLTLTLTAVVPSTSFYYLKVLTTGTALTYTYPTAHNIKTETFDMRTFVLLGFFFLGVSFAATN